jgi:hypothetical protein
MKWGYGGRLPRVVGLLLVVFAAALLGGCNTTQFGLASASGTSVAFDSIDGPPPEVFQRLVRDLNAEAKARQLAVLSRDQDAAYRVRGYMAAQTKAGQSSITWMWDVYDKERERSVRLSGEEKVAGKHRNPWEALDAATVQRIARNTMDKLGAFLAPSGATVQPAVTSEREGSPEAAGIVRVSTPQPEAAPTGKPQARTASPVTVAQSAAN